MNSEERSTDNLLWLRRIPSLWNSHFPNELARFLVHFRVELS